MVGTRSGRGRSGLRRFAVALAAASLTVVGLQATPAAAASAGTVSTYFNNGFGVEIVTGPDGNLWYTNSNGFIQSIKRLTPAGVSTTFATTGGRSPRGLALGPDGNLWFTYSASPLSSGVGKLTTAGVYTYFPLAGCCDTDILRGISSGPDGNLWVANLDADEIIRVTTAGVMTVFTDAAINSPLSITEGPDGALWFTKGAGDSIGRITTAGVVTSFAHPAAGAPTRLTEGPDGALWFTNSSGDSIERITTAGVITSFTAPSIDAPLGIAAGPDGALWFTNNFNDTIGRITTAGAVTSFASQVDGPSGIAAGPDGAMWFTSSFTNVSGVARIGRIQVTALPVAVATTSLPSGRPGGVYSTALGAVDGTLPFSWTKLSGALPPGLTLSGSGVIAGTVSSAAAEGVYSLVVRVTDATDPPFAANKALSISVAGVGFRITTATLPSATLGSPYAKALAASGGTVPYKWKKLVKLPKGLKLAGKSGVISGTPKVKGTFTVKVQVSDKAKPKRVASKTFTLLVG